MKITHYLYNSFIIESDNKKIAIDPGALFFYFLRFTSTMPKSEWNTITHIFVTHRDIDHYWYTDRMARVSNAPIICNKTMIRTIQGENLILGPRDKGLSFTTHIKKLHTSVNETIQVDGTSISGIQATHGSLTLKLGPFSKHFIPALKKGLAGERLDSIFNLMAGVLLILAIHSFMKRSGVP